MGTRFVIIAAPRTGSNRLCEQLRSQPDVWCHGEIFHPERVWIRTPDEIDPFGDACEPELRTLRDIDRCEFLNRAFALSFGRPHAGFKIFPGHGKDEALRLADDVSLAKIILFRSNFLAVYSSRLSARQTNTFSLKEMQRSERPIVTFDEIDFSRSCSSYQTYYSSVRDRLERSRQHFQLIQYEEINKRNEIASLLEFLEATPDPTSIRSPDIRGPSNILSRFSNPEVAERYLRDNGLEHWAHEGDARA